MKKIFYILCLMAGLTAAAQAQGTAPLTVQEVDGSPKKNGVTKIIVSNGTLTCTGTVCTIVTGGGGGSPGGSSSQVQYNDGAGGFAGSSGITLSATQATLVAPILGAATATSITASTAGLNFSGTNTTDNASVQLMLLRGNRATVTTNDEAYVSLSLANAAAAQKEVARLTWAIFPNTAGAEGGRMDFSVMSSGTLAKRVQLSPTDFSPSSDDGAGLGAVGTLQWSDLFLASGGVIGWNNNNYTITHSAGNLAFSGTASFATALTTGSASFDLLNTTATTINFGGAATALNMAGGSGAVVTLGGAANAASLRFMEPSGSGTNYTEFKAQAQGGNVTYTLPAADGSNGQVLSTNGSGALSWATSGGGLTIGATAIASGTAGRILYEAAANVLGETAGFSYQPATSPNLTITAQAASYVGLRINSAATPSNDIFQVTVNGTANSGFIVTSTGSPDSPWGGSRSIRYGSNHTTTGTVNDSVVFGNGNSVSSNNSIAIGTQLTTSAAGSTNNIYIGWNYTNGNTGNTIAIGKELTPGWAGLSGSSIILGIDSGGAVFSGTNNFIAGTSPHPMTNIWFGKGVTNATPTAYTINGTGGSGTNIAGADINIAGGKGTGTGATGKVNLQIARPGSTGSSLNALATAWSLNGTATSTDTAMTGGNGQTTVTGSLSESITLSTSGTTTDSTIDLPANSIILSVTGRITTTITTATDWKLGDATISDRFSDANATLTAGTTTVGINQWKADRTTAGQGPFQQSTAKVRITTTGTPGAGVIRITVHYITLTPPTS